MTRGGFGDMIPLVQKRLREGSEDRLQESEEEM